MMNSSVNEMKENLMEEFDEAVKSLYEIAGVNVEQEPKLAHEELTKKGYKVTQIREEGKPLESVFILHHGEDFVSGSIVSLNFELGQIKRTLIPHFDQLDEKFQKFIKGVNQ